MRLTGGKTGFRTVRDLLLFATGLGIDVFHVIMTAPSELSVPLLLFGAGLAGSPSILRYDERYDDKDNNQGRHRRARDEETNE